MSVSSLVKIALTLLHNISPSLSSVSSKPPNIIFILADDLGYNDVSWHNDDILSPNLDRLAKEGVILEQAYVQPICTPTRSALMSGRYPIHTGRQHSVLWPEEPRGLLADLPLLPALLKQQGYDTHAVGKWHLGFCREEFLPTSRGFDTFYGYYTGSEDYYQHNRMSTTEPKIRGYDFRDQDRVAREAVDSYSADLFADRAVNIIQQQQQANTNASHPFFLYLALQSVHGPLQVPEKYLVPFSHIKNTARRTFSGMVLAMDDAVGRVVAALEQDKELMDNTLIVFSADNGGQTLYGGNNFPLRGNKHTLWEGGTRASAFLHGSMLARSGSVSRELIHITDWFPTLVRAAGGDPSSVPGLDGMDQWDTLTRGSPSPRVEMLYNIDPMSDGEVGNGPGGALRLGSFKLIRGDAGTPDGWIPPDNVTDIGEESKSATRTVGEKMLLFDLDSDPEEKNNLAMTYPEITSYLAQLLDTYQDGMVPPDIADVMQEGNPTHFQGVWSSGWCNASLASSMPQYSFP